MERTDIVVVGFDGSAPSRTALRYAITQARRKNAPVHLLAAYDYNWQGSRFGGVETLEQIVRQRVREMVEEAIAAIHATEPDLTASGTAVLGSPGPVLIDASRTAAMVVVGNRGHGGFGSLMLGSVGAHVASHARCPVVVVRGTVDTADGPVIVGVDGSPRAEHTLSVAFDEATRRGSALIAVRAYQLPVPYGVMALGTRPFNPDELKQAEATALDESLRPWHEKYPDVPVQALVAQGSAARVLVDVSSNAGLVVVGSHGHGTIAGTLLGSVGLQLLHHADCPVLIVRQDTRTPSTPTLSMPG
jgi:nucleotide-binding universal stress UspA family protein